MRSAMKFLRLLALAYSAVASAATAESWVDESNRHAETVIAVMAAFEPERASELGAVGYDEAVIDLGPSLFGRYQTAMRALIDDLEREKAGAREARIVQDLQILVDYANRELRRATLEHELLLPYYGVAEIVYDGLSGLLRDEAPPTSHAAALQRLRKYAGISAGTTPIAELAMAQSRARFDESLLGPYRGKVEQDLEDAATLLRGVEELFSATQLAEWRDPFARLASQVDAYNAWVRGEILPRSRDDHRMPEILYAETLRDRGVEVTAQELIEEGLRAFAATRAEMEALAPLVAARHGYDATGYREVIGRLKERQLTGDRLMEYYRSALAGLQAIIRRERLVSLPERAAGIRMASEAETAREPAPHTTHPRLIGNSGEYPQFVLPHLKQQPDGSWPATDDTFEANAWTLTAHELRPGHELQFGSMIDGGTSIARAVFAWNSANIEGWGLYAESIAKPYMPLDGQLVSLQWRLLRAARMFLDPMLNLGRVEPEQAKAFLMDQVGIEEGRARSEIERYMYRMPGQAAAYFYGYARLLEIRARAELRLGASFDRKQFHDFVLAQGLLPPGLLEDAVMREFVGTAAASGSRTRPF